MGRDVLRRGGVGVFCCDLAAWKGIPTACERRWLVVSIQRADKGPYDGKWVEDKIRHLV